MPQQQSNQSPYGNPYAQGGNRYIPPTFNYATNPNNNRPNYQQMNWNTMQSHYLPTNTSQGQMNNTYQQQLRDMLGQFGQQYGDPNRRPVMPNFSSYNPGFGGATSAYDQFNQYAQQQPQRPGGGRPSQGPPGSYEDYANNFRREETPPGMMRDMSIQRGRDMPFTREEWEASQGRREWPMPEGFIPGEFGQEVPMNPDGRPGGWDNPFGGGGGQMNNDFRGRMGMMPQFNPYMMMQNSMRGMDFNQMFDPRFASLFGGDRFGSRTPNSQQPGAGGAGPQPEMVTKPLRMGGG